MDGVGSSIQPSSPTAVVGFDLVVIHGFGGFAPCTTSLKCLRIQSCD